MTQAIPCRHGRRASLWLVLAAALAGCQGTDTAPAAPPPEPGVVEATRDGPPGADPGSCWGRTVSPAVIETVTEQVQIAPAKVNPDGTIAQLPVYRTESHQQIVTPREDHWFETPCAEVLTEEFNATLQRALQARDVYDAEITGTMDPATRAAVRQFQRANGLDSGVLSLATARQLGLIAVERSTSG